MNKTIYKTDSKGKLRLLNIYTEGNVVVQLSGIVGSENLVKHESVCKGKNIGKKNETTPEEQAILEGNAKIKGKLDTEYFETMELAMTQKVMLPMLGENFSEYESKVVYPCYAQPKLDGMRGLKDGPKMTSRDNRVITTVNHILEEFRGVNEVFDGELYAHGISFQENMKLIKKYREGETEKVKYHVYDLVLPDLSFIERYNILKSLVEIHDPKNVELVPIYVINNKEELLALHSKFIGEGYEGTIVRWGDDGYKCNGRSKNLLKFKDFIDIACEIVDVVPMDKRPTHGSFVCKFPNGETNTGMKFSHKEREYILQNKHEYIGKTAEVRFFEYTDEGEPRFPVSVGIRLDK